MTRVISYCLRCHNTLSLPSYWFFDTKHWRDLFPWLYNIKSLFTAVARRLAQLVPSNLFINPCAIAACLCQNNTINDETVCQSVVHLSNIWEAQVPVEDCWIGRHLLLLLLGRLDKRHTSLDCISHSGVVGTFMAGGELSSMVFLLMGNNGGHRDAKREGYDMDRVNHVEGATTCQTKITIRKYGGYLCMCPREDLRWCGHFRLNDIQM